MRQLARFCIWVILVICLLLDGALGEAAISGCCDVGYWIAMEGGRCPGLNPGFGCQLAC